MKKALVTGALGLIGSSVSRRLLDLDYYVVGIDNNSRGTYFGSEGSVEGNEIIHRDFNLVDEPIQNYRNRENYDVIIHCAAQPSHELANQYPFWDFETNVLGTINLLELFRKNSPQATFIHLSTTKVYSDKINDWKHEELEDRYAYFDYINEETDTNGYHGIFGANKLAADLIVQEYAHEYGLNTVVLRPGCITGRNHKGTKQHGFLSYLSKCYVNDTIYSIEGSGKQVRDQLHVEDLTDAIMEIIKKPKSGVYVMGGGKENNVSILEAIKLLNVKTGKELKVTHSEGRGADHNWNVHDTSKFKKDYPNWKIKYSLDDILNDLL